MGISWLLSLLHHPHSYESQKACLDMHNKYKTDWKKHFRSGAPPKISQAQALARAASLSFSFTHTHTHTHPISCSLSLSLSLTCTHIHTHSSFFYRVQSEMCMEKWRGMKSVEIVGTEKEKNRGWRGFSGFREKTGNAQKGELLRTGWVSLFLGIRSDSFPVT